MNSKLIIKIAVGVASAAFLFSLVTLIRAMVLGTPAAFPVIQVIGSAVITVVCIVMLFMPSNGEAEEFFDDETDDERMLSDTDADTPDPFDEIDSSDDIDDTVADLYEKYHLSDFE